MLASQQAQAAQRRKKGWYHDLRLRLMKLLNVFLIVLPFVGCWLLYYSRHILLPPSPWRSAGILFLFVLLYFYFGRVYDAFLLSLKRISEMFYSQALSVFMADAFMLLTLWIVSGRFPYLPPALAALAGQLALSLLWCKHAHIWYFHRFPGQKTAVIYDVHQEIERLIGQYGLGKKFAVQFSCSAEECLRQGLDQLQGLDAVFLCGVHSHERNTILKYCVENGVGVYVIPRTGDIIMSGAQRLHLFHLPMLRVGRFNPTPEYVLIKRGFDILVSVAVLLVLSPLMLALALVIKAQDGGPVLYRQTRLTKDGRTFEILKFRSMRTDAEKDGARLSSGKDDDRITPVGRFIRACRLDELPQMFNILKGEMSVVGPRPERPEIARQYEQELPEFSLRLQAKAGLTGYAQVYGKYNTRPYDKLQMDLMYIASASLIEDLKIIFATLQILFMPESTEGIEAGQTTAMAEDGFVQTASNAPEKKKENIA